MASSIGSLSLKLVADATDFVGTLEKAQRKVTAFTAGITTKFTQGFRNITDPFRGIEAGLGSFFDLVGEGSQIKRIADIGKAARRVGVDASDFVAFMTQTGADADEMARTLTRVTNAIRKQGLTAAEATTPLEDLGFDLSKFAGKDTAASVEELARQFQRLTHSQQQAAAVALGGRQFGGLQKLLAGGPEGLAAFKDLVMRSGQGFTSADAQRAIEAGLAVKRLQGSFTGIKTQLTLAFAPLITDIANGIQGWVDRMGGGREIAKKIADVVLDIAIGVAKVGQAIETTIDDVRQLGIDFAKIGKIILEVGSAAGGIIPKGFSLFSDLLPEGTGDTLKEIFTWKTKSEQMKDEFRKKVPFGPKGKESGKGFFDSMIDSLTKAKEDVANLGTGGGGGFLGDMAAFVEDLVDKQTKLTNATNELTLKLRLEADAFGKTGAELEIFKLEQKGATDAMLAGARAALAQVHELEDLKKMADDAKSLFEATRNPVEQFGAEIERLNQLIEEGQIGWDLWGRGMQQAVDKFQSAFPAAQAGPSALLQGSAGAIQAINQEFNRTERQNPFKEATEALKRIEELNRRQLEELKKNAGEAGLLPNLIGA